MKKTFISVLILTALFTVTGCEDKEAKATIEQQTQTIAQLTAENTQLKAEKEKAEKVIPAIIAQDDVIFDKEETIKYPKSTKEDEYVPTEGKLHYSISTLKTNIEWLDKLLLAQISKNADGKPRSREQLIADYQKEYDEAKKEMLESPIIGVDELYIASITTLSLKHHKSSIDPPPRPTIITSTSGSLSAASIPLAIIGPAVEPCTGTENNLNCIRGFLCSLICKISCITAPVGDVTIPIQLDKTGIGCL